MFRYKNILESIVNPRKIPTAQPPGSVPWLRYLVAGFSLRRPGFWPSPCGGQSALGTIPFFDKHCLPPSVSVHQCATITHSSFTSLISVIIIVLRH